MNPESKESIDYRSSGVDTNASTNGLAHLLAWIQKTQNFRVGLGQLIVPVGFFASVVRLSEQFSLAFSTDGVGSKAVVAQILGEYRSIGVDCVAVNVNDVLCVGAEPIALLDYISVESPQVEMLEQLGHGLYDGAHQAGITIAGGELSQHPGALVGPRTGHAFDISGTAIAILDNREPITGINIEPGDVVLGLPSDGIHSNGLTLARKVLLGDDLAAIDKWLPDCGLTLGQELLRPTHIYTPEIKALLSNGINVKGLAHISGDGLLNLNRFGANVGYHINSLLHVPPIFDIIQQTGKVSYAEMFNVFNMGIGFCVVVNSQEVDNAMAAVAEVGGHLVPIGEVIKDSSKTIYIEQHGLTSIHGEFVATA